MRVQDVMTPHVRTCFASDTLDTPARLMWDYDCGVIPVVDTERHIVGIITDRDICMAAYTQGKPLAEIPVHHAMAAQVYTCSMGDDLNRVEHLMRDVRVRRLPVTNSEAKLVGIITLGDIARAWRTSAVSPSSEGVTRTLAAVSERVRPTS